MENYDMDNIESDEFLEIRQICQYLTIKILHCTVLQTIICELDIGKPTKLSHLAYSILLAQLIATLIHYPCTVALAGLADWSAFLGLILPTM